MPAFAEQKFSAIAFGGSYRFYKKGLIANSFYYGPRLDIWLAKITNTILSVEVAEGKGTLIAPGFEIGRAWTFGGLPSGFMVDLTFILSMYIGSAEAVADDATIATQEFKVSGFLPGGRVAIGYAF